MSSGPCVARLCDRILIHVPLPPALTRLDPCVFSLPTGSHPRESGSPPTTVGHSHQTAAPPAIDGPQVLLDRPAKTLVGMETVACAGHPKNGGGLASGRLPPVLEMVVTS